MFQMNCCSDFCLAATLAAITILGVVGCGTTDWQKNTTSYRWADNVTNPEEARAMIADGRMRAASSPAAAKPAAGAVDASVSSSSRPIPGAANKKGLKLSFLSVDPAVERIVRGAFQSNLNLAIVDQPQKTAYQVKLTQQRLSETVKPERTETVRYRDYEVNLLGAVLLMPRGASYAYELTTGGVVFDYVYDIKITKAGREIFSDRVAGVATAELSFCTDARVQNVFGGVQPAGFIANSDMERRCKGKRSADRDQAYRQIGNSIASRVLTGVSSR